ncbi:MULTISPECIES: hypothetical protein [Mesorhizobium]|uniref:Uncharacterized protein n=2 Tax=Mesorhizobium TaxID=68287 RepID=A0ABU4YPJ3_9HYPH|nr:MULTISPECIES: hypothetical protein [unclassified Mesorhizobium]MDX8461295.1 hypothetical protein [Mesorhizobium sp. VK2D]MDX8488905.1 hypothetical protein [Mesorhizobium sp. VK2B]MDX8494716.1 hypothetical protein [Mesorhizobium sp. VK22B]
MRHKGSVVSRMVPAGKVPHHDHFVRIEVGGRQVLFEKVKYESSRACGIERDAGYIYFMDRIIVA